MNQQEYIWTPDDWSRWVTALLPARQYRMQRQAGIIGEVASGIAANKVLDAGCGYGRFVELLLAKFPSVEITGCDISPSMVKACNDSFQSEGRFIAQVADLSSLPFENGVFDFAICIGVLMHVANERASLRELCRVVKPGGSLLFSFQNILSPYSVPVMIHNRVIKHGVPKQAFRTYFYFLSQLRNSGMKVLRILTDSILCIDLSPPSLSKRGLHFIPRWLLSSLNPLDRLLCRSPLKGVGFEVFVLAQKVGHEGN